MIDQTISSLFESATHPLLSYEFFPPKTNQGMDALRKTIDYLSPTQPAFVSVTYGAGGSTRAKTLEVAELLRTNALSPTMPHVTCVGMTQEQLEKLSDEIYDRGFRNIMALRGDPPKDATTFTPQKNGLHNARELVQLLKQRHPDFSCGVAGYPETHPEALSPEIEIEYLKTKVKAGASFITTQLFFDNAHYFDLVKACRKVDISVPIIPGLMPAISLKQVTRFTEVCGCAFPPNLAREMEAADSDSRDVEQVGIQWCCQQIRELLEANVPGIHLYILNRSRVATDPEFVKLLGSLNE